MAMSGRARLSAARKGVKVRASPMPERHMQMMERHAARGAGMGVTRGGRGRLFGGGREGLPVAEGAVVEEGFDGEDVV